MSDTSTLPVKAADAKELRYIRQDCDDLEPNDDGWETKIVLSLLATIDLLRAEVEAWRKGFDSVKGIKCDLFQSEQGTFRQLTIGESLSFNAAEHARQATDAAKVLEDRT
jgi:hypothetical protein